MLLIFDVKSSELGRPWKEYDATLESQTRSEEELYGYHSGYPGSPRSTARPFYRVPVVRACACARSRAASARCS